MEYVQDHMEKNINLCIRILFVMNLHLLVASNAIFSLSFNNIDICLISTSFRLVSKICIYDFYTESY